MRQWLTQAFQKFTQISIPQAAMLLAMLILAVLLSAMRGRKPWNTKMLTAASLSIALSFILSMIRLFRMPQGGSVTPACMLPLILFSYAYGAAPGICAGAVYGLLQFLNAGQFISVWSFLLDYPAAYAMAGLAGLFKGMGKRPAGLLLAVITVCFGRLLASVLSGILFYAEYAAGTGMSPLIYSFWYNGSYMLPETAICILIGLLAGPKLLRAVK